MPRSPAKPTATCQVNVRMPLELLAKLNELARAGENRNRTIVAILESAVRAKSATLGDCDDA